MSYHLPFWGGVAAGMVAAASVVVGMVYFATTPPSEQIWAVKHEGKINERERGR